MKLNYFNFREFRNDLFLLTNDFGNYCFISKSDFNSLLTNKKPTNIDELIEKGFIIDGNQELFIRSFIPRLQSLKCHLFTSTELFIFVVTRRCNLDCIYCQAKADEHNGQMMSREMAKEAVDIALSSPADNIQFEFQGGEPLFNFDVIRFIVEYAEENRREKNISFSLVSNLVLLNEEIISFIKLHNISLCTSLDGPEIVQNRNRPLQGGYGSFAGLIRSVKRVQEAGIPLSAIETTTRDSLPYAKEIVDTYYDLGFSSVFLRPLTPLGQAERNWEKIGYSPEEFCGFYKKALNHIIELNKAGKRIIENHARILLSKILGNSGENYMELRSPCGASVGQMAFYHDGNVYTCDEGRMLAEMGDSAFKLGRIGDSYETLISSTLCKAVSTASILESLPGCSDCVYMPYCGVCPVVNYRIEQNIFSRHPNSYRCKTYKGILDIIFELLQLQDYNVSRIFYDWTGNNV